MSVPSKESVGYTPPTAALNAALEVVMAIDGPASIGSPDVVSAALTAAAPFIAAQADAKLAAVEKVCAAWTVRGERDMALSKVQPNEDVAMTLLMNGADLIENARLIREAIRNATIEGAKS